MSNAIVDPGQVQAYLLGLLAALTVIVPVACATLIKVWPDVKRARDVVLGQPGQAQGLQDAVYDLKSRVDQQTPVVRSLAQQAGIDHGEDKP